ncbi:MAG: peptidoglycan DD-metalloendopeptidase family protein, partial [Gammaproteobacteria bacterium]
KKYNVKLDHLAERNRLKFPFMLRKGQKLIIVTANSHNNGKHNLNNIKTKINSKNSNVVSRNAIANNQKNNTITKQQNNLIKNTSINRISWGWPAKGKIIKTFIVSGPNKVNGIDIAGKKGDLVLSAANGRVVYSGNNLRGYGNLVIIKHNEDFLSAYAHNEKILVKEQQIVTKGQKIATMGDTDANRVVLHFEVRYKGKPIDPLKVLGIAKTNY